MVGGAQHCEIERASILLAAAHRTRPAACCSVCVCVCVCSQSHARAVPSERGVRAAGFHGAAACSIESHRCGWWRGSPVSLQCWGSLVCLPCSFVSHPQARAHERREGAVLELRRLGLRVLVALSQLAGTEASRPLGGHCGCSCTPRARPQTRQRVCKSQPLLIRRMISTNASLGSIELLCSFFPLAIFAHRSSHVFFELNELLDVFKGQKENANKYPPCVRAGWAERAT